MGSDSKKAPAAEAPAPEPQIKVLYAERFGIRLISAEDWERAGVKDHADTRWDHNNDWTVLRSDLGLNDEQYNRLIRADRGFREIVVIEPAEDGE